MKSFFVILAAIAVAGGVKLPPSTRGLHADFKDFMALYPLDEMHEVMDKYSTDKHYIAVKNYFKSKEAIKAEDAIMLLPEIENLMQWIDDNFDIYISGHNVSSDGDTIITTTTVKPHKYDFNKKHKGKRISSRTSFGGYNGYLQEIIDLIPMYEVKQLIHQKKSEAGAFAEFYKKMHDMEKFFKGLIKIPEVAKFVRHLKKMDVDVDFPWEVIKRFFGWT